MYSTCLHCTRPLGTNDVIETLPIGRRLAFDAGQGRLWVICASCGKWNLVPFDTRLESIDACERLFRDTRTRYSTDNIGLAKVGDGLTLVRVGTALRPEFASWRYGAQYRRRRNVAVGLGTVSGLAVVGAALGLSSAAGIGVGGVGYTLFQLGKAGYHGVINRRARVLASNPESGDPITIAMSSLKESAIVWEQGNPMLRVPRAWPSNLLGYHRWERSDIPRMGRRIVGGLNLTTGSMTQVRDAVDHLARYDGDLTHWLHGERERQQGKYPPATSAPILASQREAYFAESARPKVRLNALPPEQRLALEMWFSEDVERRWLEGELKMLEREWREAETLAKIADDLALTPYPTSSK